MYINFSYMYTKFVYICIRFLYVQTYINFIHVLREDAWGEGREG